MAKTLTAILIGAGSRGKGYTDIMSELGDKYKIVAVAEPIDSRRNYIRDKHGLPEEMCFTDYNPLLALGKIADLAIISTMDQLHFDPAMKAISLKYDLLLEKPVSPDPEECLQIAMQAEKMGVHVLVCHVLRYSDMFIQLKKLLNDGAVGDIVSINHEECVGNVHQSHSFVRGNWGNSGRSSCMLLQKSCHDMDILQWLIGKKCRKVQSFGTLSYFKKENAPDGSPEYCIEGCPVGDTCPYNAVKLYLDDKKNDWFRTTCARENDPTDDQVEKAIRTTQYGKCVFKCDNDVVDRHVVNLEFDGGAVATFTMTGLSADFCRQLKIFGTKGQIEANMGTKEIVLHCFGGEKETIFVDVSMEGSGHGGGDFGIMRDFIRVLRDGGESRTGAAVSLQSHLICFAAEKSRTEHIVVELF